MLARWLNTKWHNCPRFQHILLSRYKIIMNDYSNNMQFPSAPLTNTTSSTSKHKHACEILLNNFKIKDKSHRVLLNCFHLVWERCNLAKDDAPLPTVENQWKDECHGVQQNDSVDPRIHYGSNSNVLPITDIIRISRGASKSSSLRNAYSLPQSLSVNDEPQNTCQYLTIHYAKRLINSVDDCNRYQVRHLTLHNSNSHIISKWQQQLEKLLLTNSNRLAIKRLLVFINPYGGRKRGLQIYKHLCKPIVQLAGIDDCCIITQRANHINDILMAQDLSVYDAICCVGGDGTVAELVNGLIMRTMHDLNLNMQNPEYIPRPSLPVAIIPAGSTDTIAYSLHGTSDVQTCAIHLVLGQCRGLDVCSIYNNNDGGGLKRFCLSLMGYGYLGDVAVNSEKYRWMGTKRYEFAGTKAFLLNRCYSAEIRVLVEEPERKKEQTSSSSFKLHEETMCYANCKLCNTNTLINNPERQSNSTVVSEKCTFNKIKASITAADNDCLNPLSESIVMTPFSSSGQWHIIQGEFFMIIGANITCACTRSPYGVNRYGHLGDGYLELILIRKTNLLNNIRFLINSLSRNGDIRSLQFVEIYRTRQFHFKPSINNIIEQDDINAVESTQHIAQSKTNDVISQSKWNCDGEVLSDVQLTMTSHRQLINVLMRGRSPFIPTMEYTANCSICSCCKPKD